MDPPPVRGRLIRRTGFLGALAVLGALIVLSTGSMLRPSLPDQSDVDVPYDPDGPVAQRFSAFGLAGWIMRQPDGSLRAFSAADPRLGCRIEFIPVGHPLHTARSTWKGVERGMFVDRCLNSVYDADGTRLYGPTPRGLDEFAVRRVEAGRAYLDLTRVRYGPCGDRVGSAGYCSLPGRPRFGRPAGVNEVFTSFFVWPYGAP